MTDSIRFDSLNLCSCIVQCLFRISGGFMLYFLQHFFCHSTHGIASCCCLFPPVGWLMLTIPGRRQYHCSLFYRPTRSIDGISFYYRIATDRWTHTHTSFAAKSSMDRNPVIKNYNPKCPSLWHIQRPYCFVVLIILFDYPHPSFLYLSFSCTIMRSSGRVPCFFP